jgi:hypothetical protein
MSQDTAAFERRQALERIGLPDQNQPFAFATRIVTSTIYLAAGAVIPDTMNFFRETEDNNGNTFKFPQNDAGIYIRGFSVTHNLRFAGTPVDVANKNQALWEHLARLKMKYLRRDERVELRVADLVNHSFINNGGAYAAAFKGGNVQQNSWHMLPQALEIPAKGEPLFRIMTPATATLAAADATGADGDIVVPQANGSSSPFFVALNMWITEVFDAKS